MLWSEARKTYADRWIVFESLKQHEEENKLIVEDLAIVEVFSDLNIAYKYYCKLHKQDKLRKLNIGDTRKESLEFKVHGVGGYESVLMKSFKSISINKGSTVHNVLLCVGEMDRCI